MYKIIINTSQDGTILVRHNGQYSILESSIIELHRGENILDDLKYGFYLEYSIFHSNSIISIDLSEYDTSNIIDMNSMFMTCDVHELDLSNFDTHNVRDMRNMFYRCQNLKHLDLSSFDISKLWGISYMFYYCSSMEWLDVSSFTNMNCVVEYDCLFYGCHSLKRIRCTKSFKEWCLENKVAICLPISMREGGDGIWEIID